MIRAGFLSSSERRELEVCVRSQREDHGVARRANAILLLDDGKSCQVIAEFLYLDDDTIRGWYKTYHAAGWDALSTDGWKGGQSRMTSAQEAELCVWMDQRFCGSTAEIRTHIAVQFGVEYSHSGCIKLLARLGFEYRKPKGLPRVASADKQVEFIALYERLLNGLGTDEAVYFADAVHPEYQTKPAFGWVKAGSNPAVTTTAGRGRVNIHGALNLETFDAPFVEPTTVDGVSAAQLLAKIEARNPFKRIIYVIWDNAAYHKGPDVREFLERPDCRIRLIQLPPYCPHLNPIERLWAVTIPVISIPLQLRDAILVAPMIMMFCALAMAIYTLRALRYAPKEKIKDKVIGNLPGYYAFYGLYKPLGVAVAIFLLLAPLGILAFVLPALVPVLLDGWDWKAVVYFMSCVIAFIFLVIPLSMIPRVIELMKDGIAIMAVTHGASSRSWRSAAMKVCVFQWPKGA